MQRIALGLAGFTSQEKVDFTSTVIGEMTKNAATFPNPNPNLPAVTLARNNLALRLSAISSLEVSLESERAAAANAERILDSSLVQLSTYVENVAKGDASILALSGMPLSDERQPIGPLPTPGNLRTESSDLEGTVKLRWNRVKGTMSYIVECATNPNGPWTQVTVATRASCDAPGLQSGTKYWFRVRAVGAAGMSGWSDPAQKTAV